MVATMMVVVLFLTACAGAAGPPGPSRSNYSPSGYQAGLWPQRPAVELVFDVGADLRSVTGRESVVFTPDLPTCELVFRAWPNGPSLSKTGASLTVTDASVNGGPVTPQVSAAGAPPGAPGTLIDIALPTCLSPGQSVRVDLGFRLVLGADADEVIGYSPSTRTAWFATGYPLLAWVRGRGWARDPSEAMDGDGDFAVSEDFKLSLSVTAPTAYQVVGTGVAAGNTPNSAVGTTTHRFTSPAVRDVSIGVGRYTVLDRDINGVRLHLATPTEGTKTPPSAWADQLAEAVTSLTALFGPFPYPDLWVTVAPSQSDATEYPAALQFGDIKQSKLRVLTSHEVSHQWFYALVGNNQAEDPWLDEALATFGEALVGGDANQYRYNHIPSKVVGLMGQSMTYWANHGGSDRYDDAVYNQGAAILLEARHRVGADRFDAALRSYITSNAHHVATPGDFARAFSDLPAVLDLLHQAGALPDNAEPK
jgi:hypothetical protein